MGKGKSGVEESKTERLGEGEMRQYRVSHMKDIKWVKDKMIQDWVIEQQTVKTFSTIELHVTLNMPLLIM